MYDVLNRFGSGSSRIFSGQSKTNLLDHNDVAYDLVKVLLSFRLRKPLVVLPPKL